MLLRSRAFFLLAGALLAFSGCATATHEPDNLDSLKQEIRSYVVDGRYRRGIEAVAARANRWIVERAASPTFAI